MNQTNIGNQLDKLYKTYGFTIHNKEYLHVKIYLFERGRYFGADIVPLNIEKNTLEAAELLKKEYSDLGYASKVRSYENFQEAELELYKSFFSYETTSARIRQKYQRFANNQKRISGSAKYNYINGPFEINNRPADVGTILSNINNVFSIKKPQLVIIEAAAGYGKTCTAYETLQFLSDSENCENPLLTELSRNRGAKIFRYVLLDEIDREYPSLNSELVKYEIRTGRIPLIIDGFDELLDKSEIILSEKNEVFEEVESMLDTIGDLLIGNAKIILTTRKTAIFAGSEFNNWLSKWQNKFSVTRFSIREPRIKDWLGAKKLDVIKESNIPVEYIANPVLLTYLRNLTDVEFQSQSEEPEKFVDRYFNSLLKREIERQDLIIKPEEQYQIFKNVVKIMIEFDSSVEPRSFMKEMIYEQNVDLINNTLDLYSQSNKPTLENLIDKLSNHALLDRKGQNDDMIGFINDFVFGSLIGEIMSESDSKTIENKFSAYMVEIGATAYRVQNKVNKESLWKKIESLNQKFEKGSILNFDMTLKGRILRDFSEAIFQSISAFKIQFLADFTFESCVFINCKFKDCVFEMEAFKNTTFIECHFNRCSIIDDHKLDETNEIIVIKSSQEDCKIFINGKYDETVENDILNMEDKILRIIWQNEGKYKSQKYVKLIASFEKREHRVVSKIINRLEEEGIIKVKGLNMIIEINRMKEVENRIMPKN
jgi:hypothetical protein